jgi:hypothetical protein
MSYTIQVMMEAVVRARADGGTVCLTMPEVEQLHEDADGYPQGDDDTRPRAWRWFGVTIGEALIEALESAIADPEADTWDPVAWGLMSRTPGEVQ